MAISKERKQEVISQYKQWLDKSQAVILVEYTGSNMKNLDAIRSKIRETGGEFHIIKNTLVKKALEENGMSVSDSVFEKSTAAAFAFKDVAATAKALNEATKGMEVVKVKGGYIEKQSLSVAQVKALADLPPLPVARAMLLGVLQAPASKLVRTLAEPARSVASVLKAYSDQGASAAA